MKALSPTRGLQLVLKPQRVEAALWRRYAREGDSAAREALFERYLKLAGLVAASEYRRRPAYGLERSDFDQLACQGLIEAIDRFDPHRGVPFEAFARYRIKWAISAGVSRSSEGAAVYTHRRRVELERLQALKEAGDGGAEDPLATLTRFVTGLAVGFMLDEAAEIDMETGSSDVWQSVAWRDLLHSLRHAVTRLPEMEQAIVVRHYFNGAAFTEIATEMRLSRSRVSQIHKAALDRLRHHIEPPD